MPERDKSKLTVEKTRTCFDDLSGEEVFSVGPDADSIGLTISVGDPKEEEVVKSRSFTTDVARVLAQALLDAADDVDEQDAKDT